MKKYIFKTVVILILFVLYCGNIVYADSMNVQVHTQQEIIDYFNNINIDMKREITYEINPVVKSGAYSEGKLSDKTLNDAINTLNYMRYIAGIDYDVTLNDEYNKLAQAAALVNSANDDLSHYPTQPLGMDTILYEQGALGARSSNLGLGYGNLYYSIVDGWMKDESGSNLECVGHRRWILNPEMTQTGFGYVGVHSAMYCFGTNRDSEYINVAWPAQNMPLDFFGDDYPWSISTGSSQEGYENSITVKLTRKKDGKTWTFSNEASDGDFYVNNVGYGQTGCIIFKPKSIKYEEGDVFDVEITGTAKGEISYTVNFFVINSPTDIEFPDEAFILKGETLKYYADVLPIDSYQAPITFKSSNEKVVKILKSSDGYVKFKGVGNGTAIISATCESGGKVISKDCKIEVVPTEKVWNFMNSEPVLRSVKKVKKKIVKIRWWNYSNATGYQVYMSTKKKSGYKKIATIKEKNQISYKKKLKKGNVYYFKVRAYIKYKGKKYYSGYSNVKKVKI